MNKRDIILTQQKLRVWWKPQIPMKSFYVDVSSVEEGVKIMDTLTQYDIFQYENNIKPDYCNAGGLMIFDPKDDIDGPNGSWVDWFLDTPDNYFEDPREYLEYKRLHNFELNF